MGTLQPKDVTTMSMTVRKHYDTLLANVYSWMLGDFNERMREQMDFFRSHSIIPVANGVAIDLGAGNGIHFITDSRDRN